MPLKPVVRATPGQAEHLPHTLRVSNQREAARSACLECARRFRIEVDDFPRDAAGAPEPIDGWHWSLSHTRDWVAAVVYPQPVAIVVERIQTRRQELVRAAASHEELELFGGFRWENFTRLWSAKKAVLRKARLGLRDLSGARLVTLAGPRGLVLHHDDQYHYVHQRLHNAHWVSLCADLSNTSELEWDWSERPPRGAQA
jgi:phosphopantetheinyl transferase